MKKLILAVLIAIALLTVKDSFADYWWKDSQGNWHSANGGYCRQDWHGNWWCN